MSDQLTILGANLHNRRRKFNPATEADRSELAKFRKNGKWENGCPFYLEFPYLDIVTLCQVKLSDFALTALTAQKA